MKFDRQRNFNKKHVKIDYSKIGNYRAIGNIICEVINCDNRAYYHNKKNDLWLCADHVEKYGVEIKKKYVRFT